MVGLARNRSDILKYVYFESSHNYYCMKLRCDMRHVYEIKLLKALNWSQYVFAMTKVMTNKRYN